MFNDSNVMKYASLYFKYVFNIFVMQRYTSQFLRLASINIELEWL